MSAAKLLRLYHWAVLHVAVILIATGCTGRVVIGKIPPSTFQFTTVVEHVGAEPGGWQVAQVVVLLGQLSTMFPLTMVCDVEVGMPVVNFKLGYISESRAQFESARAADRAARELLGERKRPTATVCIAFHNRMEHFLRIEVPGAKVAKFRPWSGKSVVRRTFPPKRGP